MTGHVPADAASLAETVRGLVAEFAADTQTGRALARAEAVEAAAIRDAGLVAEIARQLQPLIRNARRRDNAGDTHDEWQEVTALLRRLTDTPRRVDALIREYVTAIDKPQDLPPAAVPDGHVPGQLPLIGD